MMTDVLTSLYGTATTGFIALGLAVAILACYGIARLRRRRRRR
jgi:hypothetical protein